MPDDLVYLDNQATTPVDRRVLDAMWRVYTGDVANAASVTHLPGRRAKRFVDEAREKVATVLGARPADIVFTSGATESDNLALIGAASSYASRGRHLISVASEHKAVLDPLRWLEKQGWEVTLLSVDALGHIDLAELDSSKRDDTVLISVMAANNEVGTLHPLRDVGRWAKENGVFFHTDAAQAFGKIPIDVEAMGIDMLSISAHKVYGPMGVGALWVRSRNPRVRLDEQIHGGGHERGLRSGTLNVPGIVGLGEAAEIASKEMAEEAPRLRQLAKSCLESLQSSLEDITLNGPPIEERLPGNLSVSFKGVEGEAVMEGIPSVAVSSGSACTSASDEPSHVLKAMGLSDTEIYGTLRLGIGRFTSSEDVERATEAILEQVRTIRQL